MDGILEEFDLFNEFQPNASLIPVMSTGGAAQLLSKKLDSTGDDLSTDLDYVALFHRHLGISTREMRFGTPEKQPAKLEDRFWDDAKVDHR
jgi:hypothetical protein